MTEQYTPTTEEVRDSLVYLNKYHAKQYGDVDLLVVGSETAAQFDRMIAEVAAKAWDMGCASGHREAHTNVTERNPYRQERKEQ